MIFITLTLSLLCVLTNQQTPETFKFQESDAIVKRQVTSYKSSVIHHDPKYKNGQPESVIQFEMFPQAKPEVNEKLPRPSGFGSFNNQQQTQQTQKTQQIQQDQQPHPQSVPKFAYNHNYKGGNNKNTPNLQKQSGLSNQASSAVGYKLPQTQAINVGYSVSFSGSPNAGYKFSKQPQEGSDIITGVRKDTVRQPSRFQISSDVKKPKAAVINPKPTSSNVNNQNNDAKSFINSIETQPFEYFAKTQKPTPKNTQNRAKPVSTDYEHSESIMTPSWANLSPYVELYRSEDQKKSSSQPKEQQKQVIQNLVVKPQVIDFTNFYDTQTQRSQIDVNNDVFLKNQKPMVIDFTNIFNNQAEKNQEDNINNNNNRNQFGRSEKAQINNFGFQPINYPAEETSTQQNYQQYKTLSLSSSDSGSLQTQQSENYQQISKPSVDVSQLLQKYPINAGLLQEYNPMLNLNFGTSQNNVQVGSQSQQVVQVVPQQLTSSGSANKIQDFSEIQNQNQNYQPTLNQPNYQSQYQVTNQVSSYLPQWQYGKNNFDSYFDYHYNSNLQDTPTKSSTTLNNLNYGGYGTRIKPGNSIEIHTDLQPPPESSRSRRHFIY